MKRILQGTAPVEVQRGPTKDIVSVNTSGLVSLLITQTITNADTTHAPSGDAVYDYALALSNSANAYADALVAGLSWKQAVRAATTINGADATAFANGQVIDGVTLATGDRFLRKNQTTASENGIFTVNATGAPTRALDANSGAELVNASCYVSEGTTLADTQWTCTTNSPITVGATSLAFAQLATGGGQAAIQFKDEGVNFGSSGAITSLDVVGSGGVLTTVGTAATLTLSGGGSNTSFNRGGLTVPLASAFTTFGSNGTYTDKSDRMTLAFTPNLNAISGLKQNTPSTPYTIDFAGSLHTYAATSTEVGLFGIFVSNGTAYRTFQFGLSDGLSFRMKIGSWTNGTTFSAYVSSPYTAGFFGNFWLRITDDGTTRKFLFSTNGKSYLEIYSEATNTYVTPTTCGMVGYCSTISNQAVMQHFLVTASVLGDAA